MENNLKVKIEKYLKEYKFNYTQKKIEEFTAFIEFLIEENKKYNVASIKDVDDFLQKTFIDSLIPLIKVQMKGKVIDIGSGNGFPGIILKIACPDIELTLCDAEKKKILFLERAIKHLDIDAKILYGRANSFSDEFGKYDYAVAKALVSKPDKWLRWTTPFLKEGGETINYKTEKFREELELSGIKDYLKKNSLKVRKYFYYKVSNSSRMIAFIKKM